MATENRKMPKVTYRFMVAEALAVNSQVMAGYPFGLRVDRMGTQYRLSLLWRRGPMRLTTLATGSAKEIKVAMDAAEAFAVAAQEPILVLLSACRQAFDLSCARSESRLKWTARDQEVHETLKTAILQVAKGESQP